MPTLEELERWMKGEEVEGLPSNFEKNEPKRYIGVDLAKGSTLAKVARTIGEPTAPHVHEFDRKTERCKVCFKDRAEVEREEDEDDDTTARGPSHDALAGAFGAVKRRASRGRYSIDASGTDALLLFGAHKGTHVSELAKTVRGASYLRWMLKQEFPDDLVEIIKAVLRGEPGF